VRTLVLAIAALYATPAAAQGSPQPAGVQIAALAPAPTPTDDARRAVAIGPAGEVYEPDGKGAWVRRQRMTTAGKISSAARAGGGIVAFGEGVVYRLALNGWSAIRLAQREKAKLAVGWTAVAAVGRQVLALDRLAGGEPAKLGTAAGEILMVGSGTATVVATDRGLFRIDGAKVVPIPAPKRAKLLVGDRWAVVDGGAVDLRSGKTTAWPAGAAIEVVDVGPEERLVAVARTGGKLELVVVRAGKLERVPVDATGTPVGVAVDRGGRAVVAFNDGRLAVRDGAVWTTVTVREELPTPRPGPPPAASH
jgi:hypothetical protein